MNECASFSERSAADYVAKCGVVLASAKGVVPRLVDKIAGEVIVGNWWVHPRANEIYNILRAVQEHSDILVCRLINDKLTLVHRRLWPALARLAPTLDPRKTSRVTEEHTTSGRHEVRESPYPEWVPVQVLREAERLSEQEARDLLGLRPRWQPGVKPVVRRTDRLRVRDDA